MKNLSWGTRLVISMATFMLFLIVMLLVVLNNRQEIVVDDYYPRELKHQMVIDMKQNYNNLGQSVDTRVDSTGLLVMLPAAFHGKKVVGNLWFYSPSDRAADFELPFTVDSAGWQFVPMPLLKKSRYLLKMKWNCNGTGYYHETEVTIPPSGKNNSNQ